MSLRIGTPTNPTYASASPYALGTVAPAGCACEVAPAGSGDVVRPAGQLGGSFSVSIPGWAVAGALILGGYYLYTRR